MMDGSSKNLTQATWRLLRRMAAQPPAALLLHYSPASSELSAVSDEPDVSNPPFFHNLPTPLFLKLQLRGAPPASTHTHSFITPWASQFSPAPTCAFYPVWVISSQIHGTILLPTSIWLTIKGKRHHKCREAFTKKNKQMTFVPNTSPELVFQHCSQSTLLCHEPEPAHCSHQLGHLEVRNVATSRHTRISTSIKAFLGWLKQCKCAAHGHIYIRFSFSFRVKIQVQWGWIEGLQLNAPRGRKKSSWTIQEPPVRAEWAERYRQYSTESTAEDFYDHLWQSIAQLDDKQTEGLEGNQWDSNTKLGEITGL